MFLDTDFLRSEEIRLVLEKTVEADPAKNWLSAYHFAICDLAGTKMGNCDLRIGHNESVYYGGNIGYRVEEPYRGHPAAVRAGEAARDGISYHHLRSGQLALPENLRMAGRRTAGNRGAAGGQRHARGGRGDA